MGFRLSFPTPLPVLTLAVSSDSKIGPGTDIGVREKVGTFHTLSFFFFFFFFFPKDKAVAHLLLDRHFHNIIYPIYEVLSLSFSHR